MRFNTLMNPPHSMRSKREPTMKKEEGTQRMKSKLNRNNVLM